MSSKIMTAVVTGASSGIGKAICQHFLDAGYRVVSLSRRACPIEHENLLHIPLDLSDVDAVRSQAEAIARYQPTTLVLNAGVSMKKSVGDLRVEDLSGQINLALVSSVVLLQACLPAMRAAKFGRVVIISTRAILGLAGVSAYSAAKAAQLGLARSWALELGPEGITANVIAPGPIKTEMFLANVTAEAAAAKEAAMAAALPVRRMGLPGDIARLALFLSAPENGFITGQTIFVCGGASVGGLNTLAATSAVTNRMGKST
jgi:NAD(P)-dependent dehydrogenase (short-subunit alcohol dehydrogenase family)